MENRPQYRNQSREIARIGLYLASTDSTLASLHDVLSVEIARSAKECKLPQHVREHLEFFNARFGN